MVELRSDEVTLSDIRFLNFLPKLPKVHDSILYFAEFLRDYSKRVSE